MLLFKKKFLDAIRRGEKTQTVRLWVRPRMKAGQRSYIPGVGYIHIAAVEQVEVADLTDEDARPDGFPTADALRAEISAIYSQYPDRGQKAYRIKFTLAPGEVKREKPKVLGAVAVTRTKSATNPQTASTLGVADFLPSQAIPAGASVSRLKLPPDGFLVGQRRRNSINP